MTKKVTTTLLTGVFIFFSILSINLGVLSKSEINSGANLLKSKYHSTKNVVSDTRIVKKVSRYTDTIQEKREEKQLQKESQYSNQITRIIEDYESGENSRTKTILLVFDEILKSVVFD